MFRIEAGEKVIYARPVRMADLELIKAWRSDPEVHEHLPTQEDSLAWETHVEWYHQRPARREDFVLSYGGRRIGVASINHEDFVTIYVGEKELWNEGIGSAVLDWLCELYGETRDIKTNVLTENETSQRMLERREWELVETNEGILTYEYIG